MGAKKRTRQQIQSDLAIIAEQYLMARTHENITKHLAELRGVENYISRSQVTKDIKKLVKMWKKQAMDFLQERIFIELAKLDKREEICWDNYNEAMAAWHESKKYIKIQSTSKGKKDKQRQKKKREREEYPPSYIRAFHLVNGFTYPFSNGFDKTKCYVIRGTKTKKDTDRGLNIVYKIGRTEDVDRRMTELKKKYEGELTLELIKVFDYDIEFYVHRLFKDKRLDGKGELFDLDSEDLRLISMFQCSENPNYKLFLDPKSERRFMPEEEEDDNPDSIEQSNVEIKTPGDSRYLSAAKGWISEINKITIIRAKILGYEQLSLNMKVEGEVQIKSQTSQTNITVIPMPVVHPIQEPNQNVQHLLPKSLDDFEEAIVED